MIQKLFQRISLYRNLRFLQYLYLNYFCSQVVRTDNSRILPYKHAVIDLHPTAKILLGGGDLEIGCDRLRGSRAETLIRLRAGSVWSCEGGCRISYGTTVEVLQNGCLDSQYFTLNTGSVIVAAKRILIGQDVMIGRNVILYDSDHHTVLDAQKHTKNPDAAVEIGDHVWLATNVTVLKGSCIGRNSLIGANSTVQGMIEPNSLYKTVHTGQIRTGYGTWDRSHPI